MPTLEDDFSGIVEALGDVLWNKFLEQFEEVFTISGGVDSSILELSRNILEAQQTGRNVLLSESWEYDELHLLLACQNLTRNLSYEVAVVGLTKPNHERPLTSVFASGGGAASVSIPHLAVKEIRSRLSRGVTSKAFLIHNHPTSLVHSLLKVDAFGPSMTDRNTALSLQLRWWLDTGGKLLPEFYLVEGDSFRKFVFPSSQVVIATLKTLGVIK